MKEVLSETPFHATTTPESLNPKATPGVDCRSPEFQPPTFEVEPLKLEEETTAPPLTEDGDASEYSELCSVGESFSTATTTTINTSAAAERGEVDDSDVTSRDYCHVDRIKKRVVRRSAGGRVPKKQPPTLKPPMSRSELPQARSVPRQERSTHGNMEHTSLRTRTRNELTNQNSRSSTATPTRVGGARRNPAKRGGNSGGKMVGLSERVVGEGNIAKNLLTDEKTVSEKMKTTADESLDNPLVSLECFIFL